VLLLQVLPSVIYLAAQVVAIKQTFNSIFEINPDSIYPVIIIMVLILIFEWAGGLSSVVLTDAIQALIMVVSFVSIPIVLTKNFGGWKDLDPATYAKPEFYQTPTKDQQWDFWQFSLVNFSFFTLPHFVQRVYAARDLNSLKAGYYVIAVGPWYTSLVGVFMGTVGVMLLANDDGTPKVSTSPFTDIIEAIMNLGGFAKGLGVIIITASLAAIMSTADSLIIAISQLITAEIIYPLKPDSTPYSIAWYGRFTSLISVAFALLIG
jgi:Na+/proline symporter